MRRKSQFGQYWPELTAIAVLVIAFWPLSQMPLHHDVVWQLRIGRELLHGAELYTDISELNPPLWFWISVPIVAFGEFAGVASRSILIGGFLAASGIAILLTARLVAGQPAWQRAALYGMMLFSFILLVLDNFGQREHFTLVATVPYIVLISRRAEGRSVSTLLAFSIGLFAAVGLALKYYFVLVPLALEMWLFLVSRSNWRALRPELFALGFVALTYVPAALIYSPAYVTDIVPMIRLAYGGYTTSIPMMFTQPVILIYIFATAGFVLYGKPKSRLSQAAVIASLAFLIIYFAQMRGWRYHTLPASGFMLLAITTELYEASFDTARRRAAAIMFSLALASTAILSASEGPYSNSNRGPIMAAFAGLQPGEPAFMITAHPSAVWPMVDELGLVWPSRHFAFWMLPTFASHRSPELDEFAMLVRHQTARDIGCTQPKRILIDDASWPSFRDHHDFDLLAFFLQDPTFRAQFRYYQEVGKVGRFRRFDLRSSFARPQGCQ